MSTEIESNFEIKSCGKLPNSSYFDRPNRVLCPNTNTFTETIIENQVANNLQQQTGVTDVNLNVKSCIFSPDGTYLSWTCGYKIIKIMKYRDSAKLKRSFSFDQQAKVLEENELRLNHLKVSEITEIECAETVKSLAFGSSKSQIPNRHNLHLPRRKSSSSPRFSISENNLLLAVGLISGKIRIYDATSLTFILGLFDHTDLVNDLKFTQDGSLQLASASSDETIKLWNIFEDGNMYKTLKGHTGKVNACDWSPVAKMLCSAGVNRQAYIWDTENFKLLHTLRAHLHNVSSCQFSPDGALVATGSYDTKICIWNPFTGTLIKQFFHMLPPPRLIYAGGDNGAFIRSLAFSKEGDHIVSICDDKKIRIWTLCNRSNYPIAEGELKDGVSCAYSSSTRTVMIGTKNGQVDVYKVPLIIPKLVDICRKIVNQIIDQPVYELNLPKELKKFLLYDDIRDDSIMTNSSPMLIISSPNTPASASTSPNPTLFNQGTPAMCN